MTKIFKPMKGDDAIRALLKPPYMMTPKYDGLRCLFQNGEAFTSSMKLQPNRYLQILASSGELDGIDCEIIVGEPNDPDVFRRTTPMRGREANLDFSLYAFDDFTHVNDPSDHRFARLTDRLAKLDGMPVKLVPMWYIKTVAEMEERERDLIAQGYEGAMLRSPHSPYKFGRATARENWLLKLKEMMDHEAEIIDIHEQMHNTNEAKTNELGRTKRSSAKAGKVGKGVMGAVQIRVLNGPFAGKEFALGTGFSDEQRKQIWDEWPRAKGLCVSFHYQFVGGYDLPRIASFRRFRPRHEIES